MSFSDLILLLIVVAFFGRKLYQKRKGKGMKATVSEQVRSCRKVDVWKHVLNVDNDLICEELEVFINKNIQRYADQGISPDIEYRFNCNVFYMFVTY